MKHILLHQPLISKITKSLNQYLDINAQKSDEIQTLDNYENSTVVFDDKLLSKQASNTDLFFAGGRHSNIDIHYVSQSYFQLQKNTILNNSNINILFKLYGISYFCFMT